MNPEEDNRSPEEKMMPSNERLRNMSNEEFRATMAVHTAMHDQRMRDMPASRGIGGGGQDSKSDALNPGNLKERERVGSGGAKKSDDQQHTDEESNNIAKNFGDEAKHPLGAEETGPGLYKGKHRSPTKTDKAKGFLKKHKKWLMGVGVGGAVILPLLLFLLFIAASLKIPHFAENVVLWQFAKMTRVNAESQQAVMDEKAAIDSMDDVNYTHAAQQYSKNNIFDKINRLRPNKIVSNLQAANIGTKTIKYNYKNTLLGRGRLLSISVYDRPTDTTTKIELNKPGFFRQYIHPIQTLQEKLDNYNLIANALNDAIKSNDPRVPTLIRSLAIKKIIQERMGASLAGLVAAKYKGKNSEQAKVVMEQEAYADIDNSSATGTSGSDNLNEAEKKAQEAEKNCVADAKCAAQLAQNKGQLNEASADIIDSTLTASGMKGLADKIIGVANPVYAAMVPICIIYEGSKISAPTINAQTTETERTGMLVLSTADQQKEGGGVNLASAFLHGGSLYGNFGDTATTASTTGWNAEAAGAMNWKLGDITNSVPMQRAAGHNPDSRSALGTQTSIFGNYNTDQTIFNVVAKPIAPALNASANALCPTLTNVWVGIGLGIANIAQVIVTGFFTGGGATAAEAAGDAAVEGAAEAATQSVVERLLAQVATKEGLKTILSNTGRFGKQFLKDTVKQGAAIAGATFLAKYIVMSQMGSVHNGLGVGESFTEDADNGVNQASNEFCRGAYGCRPTTTSETMQSHVADQKIITARTASESAYDRYLAVGNSTSLLSRLADTTAATFNRHIFANFLNGIAHLFNPLTLLPKIFGSLNTRASLADGNVDSTSYDNVQFDWPQSELDLIHKNISYYSPSANEQILDDSGKKDEIATKYGPCFSDSIGDLLEKKMIVRDGGGGIKDDDALCAPHNLGPNNADYGDLVFRWRLDMNRNSAADIPTGIQAVNVTVQ